MEWVDGPVLFVHGGPLDLGTQTLRLKCWQRLSHTAGDSFTGTITLHRWRLTHSKNAALPIWSAGTSIPISAAVKPWMGSGSTPSGLYREKDILFPGEEIEVARIPLDMPTLFRLGGCHGKMPEFAYADRTTFTYPRVAAKPGALTPHNSLEICRIIWRGPRCATRTLVFLAFSKDYLKKSGCDF